MILTETAPARPRHRKAQSTGYRFGVRDTAAVAALIVAVGLTIVAYHMARTSTGTAHFAVFWAGQILGFGTCVWFGLRVRVTKNARLTALAVYALFNLLPKFIISPSHAVYFDEYGHWRQALNIVSTGSARPYNAFQPIIPDYPGLEWATAGVHFVTRLSVWHSGQVIIAVAHIAVLLAIFGLTRLLLHSEQVAFIAALAYSLNPSFQYFETQFSYESLGLALALLTAYAVARARSAHASTVAWRWSGGAALLGIATVVTHHLSAAFAGFLAVLLCIFLRPRASRGIRATLVAPWLATALTGGVMAVWLTLVASGTYAYVGPNVVPAFGQLLDRVFGTAGTASGTGASGARTAPTARSLFAGAQIPTYEHLAAVASPFVVLALCLIGIAPRARRRRAARVVGMPPFVLLAALYFASLPFALTVAGSEGVHRSWAESYLGVAVLAALGVARLTSGLSSRRWCVVAAGLAAVVMIGNVAVGEDVEYRFPGPYEFASDTRSVTSETLAVVSWLNKHARAGVGVVSDRFTNEAIEGYSDLTVVAPNQSTANLIYEYGGSSPGLRQYLRQNHFSYFVFDKRIEDFDASRALFLGYAGSGAVSATAVAGMTRDGYARIVHETHNYTVYELAR